MSFRRALVAALLGLTAPLAAAELAQTAWEGETMGSVYVVKIAGTNLPQSALESVRNAIETRLKDLNRQMSHYQPESELSRFNRAPVDEPFPVSRDLADVLRLAGEVHRRSEGAFDPTLGPVIKLWGFGEGTEARHTPDEASLRAALQQVGFAKLRVTPDNRLVKAQSGLQLNLGAIGKGAGVDAMAGVLRARGFTNFYVAISGDVYGAGQNARGLPWQVAISAPMDAWRPGDPAVTILGLSDRAVSTSGDYQKFFVDAQGLRQCHIFDPRTGHPVRHNLGSVSVVADSSALADALSTTLFVLGQERGLEWIETWTNAAALFVVREAEGKFRTVQSRRFGPYLSGRLR